MTQGKIKSIHDYIDEALQKAEQSAPVGAGKYPWMVGYYEATLKSIKDDMAVHLKPTKKPKK